MALTRRYEGFVAGGVAYEVSEDDSTELGDFHDSVVFVPADEKSSLPHANVFIRPEDRIKNPTGIRIGARTSKLGSANPGSKNDITRHRGVVELVDEDMSFPPLDGEVQRYQTLASEAAKLVVEAYMGME